MTSSCFPEVGSSISPAAGLPVVPSLEHLEAFFQHLRLYVWERARLDNLVRFIQTKILSGSWSVWDLRSFPLSCRFLHGLWFSYDSRILSINWWQPFKTISYDRNADRWTQSWDEASLVSVHQVPWMADVSLHSMPLGRHSLSLFQPLLGGVFH